MDKSNTAGESGSSRRWVVVPILFALWTAAVVFTLRSFAERIPELRLVGLGLSLDSLKVVVAGVTSVMKEDLFQLVCLLSFLFL